MKVNRPAFARRKFILHDPSPNLGRGVLAIKITGKAQPLRVEDTISFVVQAVLYQREEDWRRAYDKNARISDNHVAMLFGESLVVLIKNYLAAIGTGNRIRADEFCCM